MNAIKRGLRGAALGAAVTTVVTVTLSVLVFGLVAFAFEAPLHRADELHNLVRFLPLAVSAGIIVGTLGGFAARMPRKSVSILTSIGIVAACAIVGGFLRVTEPRFKGSPEPPFLLPTLGALVGGVLVLWYGIQASKRATANESAGRSDKANAAIPSTDAGDTIPRVDNSPE